MYQMHDNPAPYIDHTLLAPDATEQQILTLCQDALQYRFASVCVNPVWVKLAAQTLRGSSVKVATVIGFPLGATSTQAKVAESQIALQDGADELDMVVQIGMVKGGQLQQVQDDIAAVVSTGAKVVKVILETCKLTDDEIVAATKCAVRASAHFVKTSTGFGGGGATEHDVRLMRANCADLQVKASGGIRDLDTAEKMLLAGAMRLGTSSGVKIVQQWLELQK